MANSDKDIKITPNTGQSAKPKIEVTGADNAVKTLTINDDGSITFDSTLTVSDLTVSGTTTTLNTATMTVEDKNIVLGSGNATSEVVDATGITLEGGSGDDITFQYNATDNRMELKHGSAFEDLKAGTVTGTFVGDITGDVTGNADTSTKIASITNSNIVQLAATQTLTNKTLTSPTITGTGTIAGTFTGDITGDVTGNADTATKIASITNSNIVQLASTQTLTNKTLTTPIIATIKADSDSSHTVPNVASDTFAMLAAAQTLTNKTLTSPTITGTGAIAGTFTGDLTGDVTGNVSGSAATVTGAAQSAITSLGTLTSLTGGTGDLIWDTNTLVVDSSESRVGIGTASPTASLDVAQGGAGSLMTIIGGADLGAATRTNDTRKFFRMGMPHYHNAEEPFNILCGDSSGTQNKVIIGGGTSLGNAATDILFNTAANDATTTGTTRMIIDESGNVGIGTTSPSTALEVSGTLTVGNAALESNQFRINNTGGYGQIELGGSSGAFIDLKNPFSDDYDLRLISSGTGGTIQTSGNANLGLNVGSGNVAITGNLTVSGSYNLANSDLPDLAVSDFAASAIVLESEGIGSNDNDTTLPTSAAVKDYVDNNAGGSVGGSDTELLYNDGGTENGIASLTWTDTAGSEQLKLTDESDTALFKIEQTGTGNVFEAHDQASDSNIFKIDNAGKTVIGASSSSTAHSAFFLYVNGDTRLSRLRVGTGSNAEPGVHFEGDSDTGIRRSAANQLGFITGGSERLSVGSAGEILIGGSAAGTSGQVLTSGGSGAAVSWGDVSASPAGSDSQIQYNNGGSLGGDADFTWDDTNNRLVIGSVTSQHDSLGKLTVKGTDASFLLEKHDDSASGGPSMTLYRYSASEADGDLIGQVVFRGEGSTGNPSTYMMLRAEILDTTEGTKDGQFIFRGLKGNSQTDFMTVGSNGVRNMIGSVIAVSSNTTLTDDQSGSYVYWTGGTLTLPATAIQGQQYTVINNTNGSATPALGTSNSIATNWTAHAAMADETARTYVAVAANTWIYVG